MTCFTGKSEEGKEVPNPKFQIRSHAQRDHRREDVLFESFEIFRGSINCRFQDEGGEAQPMLPSPGGWSGNRELGIWNLEFLWSLELGFGSLSQVFPEWVWTNWREASSRRTTTQASRPTMT